MKAILYLALVAGLAMGCIWAYKKFLASENKAAAEIVETIKEPEPARINPTAPVDNLSTARTPVAKSKIGKKINKIYSDHNRGVGKAAE